MEGCDADSCSVEGRCLFTTRTTTLEDVSTLKMSLYSGCVPPPASVVCMIYTSSDLEYIISLNKTLKKLHVRPWNTLGILKTKFWVVCVRIRTLENEAAEWLEWKSQDRE